MSERAGEHVRGEKERKRRVSLTPVLGLASCFVNLASITSTSTTVLDLWKKNKSVLHLPAGKLKKGYVGTMI
jgi:hypothetical protein